MAVSEAARKNHDELFPGHVSTLGAATDPELIEIFDDFAFDEVLRYGNLNVGNNRGVLQSVITQLRPFIGYPRALNALRAVDEVARS